MITMTPGEIRLTHENVNQSAVDELFAYLDNWMASQKQPSKELKKTLAEMKKENCPPSDQARQAFGSLYDWFAYGN